MKKVVKEKRGGSFVLRKAKIGGVLLFMAALFNLLNTGSVLATEYVYNYPLPEGYTTVLDQTFYECIAEEFKEEFPDETVPETGLTPAQLSKITSLTCIAYQGNAKGVVRDTTGLEEMRSLTKLVMPYNPLIEIDISHNELLESINLHSAQLESLDVSNNKALKTLEISHNNITELNLENNVLLEMLDVYDQRDLASLDVSNNTLLNNLDIRLNNIQTIDLSNNPMLARLNAAHNALTELDVSNNKLLKSLSAEHNSLTALNISNNEFLEYLNIEGNQLTSLNVSNNKNLTYLRIDNILVIARLRPVSENPLSFKLSDLKFFNSSIDSTDEYEYDRESKILTIKNGDWENTSALVKSYIDSDSHVYYGAYKLRVGPILEEENVDIIDTETNISVPDTGQNIDKHDNSKILAVYSLPVAAICIASIVFAKKRKQGHKKFD